MRPRMLFVISAPRSGSTMLERMLESHSMILGGPEPHLLTPLAHLGVWAKVDKAPYDHILAAESQRLFVERLPNKEQDYWEACRAYCDVLYGRCLETSTKEIFLDKTPAYALVLPFLEKVFPDGKYIVLTRHPAALFSSYANSFFNGDYRAAHAYNPILHRYVPAIADFLRRGGVARFHVRYEDLVMDPREWMRRIYEFVGVPFEEGTIEYGAGRRFVESKQGLGDPLGVDRHVRPVTDSVEKWAAEVAVDAAKRAFLEEIIGALDPDDLRILGYPPEGLWEPLERVSGKSVSVPRSKWSFYKVQRWLIVRLRGLARRSRAFRRVLETVRLGCEVLLRE